MKKVCFFGNYKQNHRNHTLVSGLEAHGIEVLQCRDDSLAPGKAIRLIRKYWKLRNSFDVLLVGFPNHKLVLLARLLTRKPIIFDPFVSLYNTDVEDRKLRSKYRPKAFFFYILDYISMHLAHVVIADTAAHAAYFSRTFRISSDKCVVVPVGANTDLFYSSQNNAPDQKEFTVKFYGSYSPLQGVPYIIEAAKLLAGEPGIHFYLVGDGQTLDAAKEQAKTSSVQNVTFITKRIPTEELRTFLDTADVCLGIFGGTIKSNMVVPHKVYDALAMKKAVVTGDTAAAREFFVDGEHLLLCREADARDLADKLLLLKRDPVLRARIAAKGRELLVQNFVPHSVVESLVRTINAV